MERFVIDYILCRSRVGVCFAHFSLSIYLFILFILGGEGYYTVKMRKPIVPLSKKHEPAAYPPNNIEHLEAWTFLF